MALLVEMPLAIYQDFLGRCLLDSREFEILKNSVISHVQHGNVVEFLCTVEEAKLLLTRANLFYRSAASYIEESLRLLEDLTQSAYRKLTAGKTWHFCPSCSQWPTDDFISSTNLPQAAEACNECVVKADQGES